MNTSPNILTPVLPLGWHLSWLSKMYFGALTRKLEHLDIDRYFVVLLLLHSKAAPMCQQEMCEALHIDKTYMVKVIDYLQNAGHISRSASPHDRRMQMISLTSKGKETVPVIRQALAEIDNEVLGQFSAGEVRQLIATLSQLGEGLLDIPRNEVTLNYKSIKK